MNDTVDDPTTMSAVAAFDEALARARDQEGVPLPALPRRTRGKAPERQVRLLRKDLSRRFAHNQPPEDVAAMVRISLRRLRREETRLRRRHTALTVRNFLARYWPVRYWRVRYWPVLIGFILLGVMLSAAYLYRDELRGVIDALPGNLPNAQPSTPAPAPGTTPPPTSGGPVP